MTDQPRPEDPSLASFGRYLLGGGVLGMGIGASWEVMSWFWTPGQFPPLRLLLWGAVLGLVGGHVAWFARAASGRRPDDAKLATKQPAKGIAVGRPARNFLTRKAFAACSALGAMVGAACAVSGLSGRGDVEAGEVIFLFVGWTCFGAGMGVFALLIRDAMENGHRAPAPTTRDMSTRREHPARSPASFEQRLSAYLHCSEQELRRPQRRPQSRMPYWSIVDFRSYSGPKPLWIIRRILEQIHDSIRASSHR